MCVYVCVYVCVRVCVKVSLVVRVRTLRVALVALRHRLVQSASVLRAFSALVKGWSLWSLDVVTVCLSVRLSPSRLL